MPDPRYLPGTSTPEPSASPEPLMRWPSWMDAQYQLVASHFQARVLHFTGSGAGIQVEGNARRWAIGFANQVGSSAAFSASPFDLGSAFGFQTSLNFPTIHFTVFTHGPLVGAPWMVYCATITDILVYEIILQ